MKVPILKLNDVLLTSIQVELSDEDALNFQSELLHAVSKSGVKGLIIDITAMDVVDSFMARLLNDTATMVSLLGARAVLCGIQPAVALTLVEMGRELIGVETALNLDQAMENIKQDMPLGKD